MELYKKYLKEAVQLDKNQINVVKDVKKALEGVKSDKSTGMRGSMTFSGSVGVYWQDFGQSLHINFPAQYGKAVESKVIKVLKKYKMKSKVGRGASNIVITATR